jgi:hypothetical protein
MKGDKDAPAVFIHPVYVEMQKQSPMGMMKDFNVSEIDVTQKSMGEHEFYHDYVSKSLPLVLRHGADDWDMKKNI